MQQNCQSCANSKWLQNNVCVSTCNTGKYKSPVNPSSQDGVCASCNANCYTCVTNATNCQSCANSKWLQNNVCVSTCNTGKYKSPVNPSSQDGVCASCNANCYTCVTNATNCQSCANSNGYKIMFVLAHAILVNTKVL